MSVHTSGLSRADCLPSNPWRAWVEQNTEEGGMCPLLWPYWLGWDMPSYLRPSDLSLSSLPLPLQTTKGSSLNHKPLSAFSKSSCLPPQSWAWHPKHQTELMILTPKSGLKVKNPGMAESERTSETQHPQVHKWRNWNPEKLSSMAHCSSWRRQDQNPGGQLVVQPPLFEQTNSMTMFMFLIKITLNKMP